MTEVNIGKLVAGSYPAFRNRRDAGAKLADFVGADPGADPVVLALPRGGVPVAGVLAESVGAPLQLVVARKLPIPSAPEMGFGAIAIDGTLVLNDGLVAEVGLKDEDIDRIAAEVRAEVERRAREYTGEASTPDVRGKTVYLVDDGLATGYSAIAAAKMVNGLGPRRIVLGIPVSPENSVRTVAPYFDLIYCLIAQKRPPFAVASYYEDFHEMTDREVLEILASAGAARH